MTVKTFKAQSIQEALQMVRESLGPHATILETRTIQAGLLPWFKRPSHVLVSASTGVKIPQRLPAQQRPALSTIRTEPLEQSEHPLHNEQEIDNATAGTPSSYVEQLYQREQHTERQTSQVANPDRTDSTSSTDPVLYEELRSAGLNHWAIDFLQQAALVCNPLATGEMLRKEIVRALSRAIQTTSILPGSGLRTLNVSTADRVLFYGLSGTGKSTTIAKLATQLQLRQDRSIAVIDIRPPDQNRTDWLLSHLENLGIKNISCTDPATLDTALTQFQSLDYILIDTPGIAIKSKAQQNWFNAMLQQINAHQSHLICSSTSHCQHITDLIRGQLQIHPTSLVLTKLDEIKTAGHLFTLLQETGLPVSLLTTGPELADSYEDVNPELLAQFITKLTPIGKQHKYQESGTANR